MDSENTKREPKRPKGFVVPVDENHVVRVNLFEEIRLALCWIFLRRRLLRNARAEQEAAGRLQVVLDLGEESFTSHHRALVAKDPQEPTEKSQ